MHALSLKYWYLKRRGSEAFAKVEKKAPLSQPGLEPGSSTYTTDALPLELLGPAHVQISSIPQSLHFAFASQHKPHRKAHLTKSAPTGPSFPLSQMLRFPFFSDFIFLPFFNLIRICKRQYDKFLWLMVADPGCSELCHPSGAAGLGHSNNLRDAVPPRYSCISCVSSPPSKRQLRSFVVV